MSYVFNGDPHELIPAAQKGIGLQGNHEGYLKALLAVKDELEAAVRSPQATPAIASSMQNALDKGNRLGNAFQDILNVLTDSAHKFSAADMDAYADLIRQQEQLHGGAQALGTDMGGGAGNVASSTMSGKVDIGF